MTEKAQDRTGRVERRKAFQDENVFSRMSSAAAASRAQARRILQHAGVSSIVEWRVLWDLAETGPLTVNDMARIQRLDHSLFSRAVAQMRAKGWVSVERDDVDKRQMLFSLTEAGEAVFSRAAPLMRARRRGLRAAMPDEDRARLLSLIDQFEAFLEAPLDLPDTDVRAAE